MDRQKLGVSANAGVENEIKALKVLNQHPNIVKMVHTQEANGLVFLVMELLEGGELLDYLYGSSTNTLPDAEASCVACQVASAVQHCHEHHIVHRDLSPSNILLVNKNSLKQIKIIGTIFFP
jgi:serine/threonine protein kinase